LDKVSDYSVDQDVLQGNNITLKMANEDSRELLQQQQIPGLPQSMFYIPNFINEDEEQRILEKVC